MQRARAAVDHHHETAGIEAALGRHRLDGIGHRRDGDAQNAIGGLRDVEPERRGELLLHRAFGRGNVELHFAAEEVVGVEPAQQHIGVGHGRLRPAAAVAGGSGNRAALCGPTRNELPSPTRAMLPPPVPTSKMSIIGIWIGSAFS